MGNSELVKVYVKDNDYAIMHGVLLYRDDHRLEVMFSGGSVKLTLVWSNTHYSTEHAGVTLVSDGKVLK